MSSIRDHFPTIFSGAQRAVVFELGANIGSDTELIRQAAGGDACRYIAVEPDPICAAAFRQAHQGKPITFIQAAVADRNGLAVFSGSTGGNSGTLKIPRKHLTEFPDVLFPPELVSLVPTVTLDEVFLRSGVGGVDFIWCDVQGAEDLVISGGSNALSFTRYFFTEYYDTEIYSGQIPLAEIHRRLPGDWELAQRWETDALFRNKSITYG